MLTQRIFQYRLLGCVIHRGFIPDITRIMHKYGLIDYLDTFCKNSQFPSRYEWKRISKSAIFRVEEQSWQERMSRSPVFDTFRQVQTELSPSNIWTTSLKMPGTLPVSQHLARLCTFTKSTFHDEIICPRCWSICDNEFKHLVVECGDLAVRNIVSKFWRGFASEIWDWGL